MVSGSPWQHSIHPAPQAQHGTLAPTDHRVQQMAGWSGRGYPEVGVAELFHRHEFVGCHWFREHGEVEVDGGGVLFHRDRSGAVG